MAGSLITLLGVLGAVLAVANDPYVEPARPGFTPPPNAVNELTFSIPRLVELVHGHTADLPQEVTAKARAASNADEFDLKRDQEQLKRAQDRLAFWRWVEFWVFAAMMVGFAIKVPLFPVHTWLPLAHVEAPTAGSVLLAGVLLKIGVYGFLRLCIPLAPDASLSLGTPLIGWLGVVGVLYGSFCALAQDDIKKLVAYSSVAHLGYCMIGLFALNETGIAGGVLQMINHGLSTGALFLLVGMLYERYHTRKMADYSGMAARLKWTAVFWVFITMSSIGLPGLNGFVSETLTMMGMYAFQRPEVPGWLLSGLATGGILLGAWYMLMLLRRVFFGELREPAHEGHGRVADLNGREWLRWRRSAALCLFLGVWSQPFLDSIGPDLQVVVAHHRRGEGTRRRRLECGRLSQRLRRRRRSPYREKTHLERRHYPGFDRLFAACSVRSRPRRRRLRPLPRRHVARRPELVGRRRFGQPWPRGRCPGVHDGHMSDGRGGRGGQCANRVQTEGCRRETERRRSESDVGKKVRRAVGATPRRRLRQSCVEQPARVVSQSAGPCRRRRPGADELERSPRPSGRRVPRLHSADDGRPLSYRSGE